MRLLLCGIRTNQVKDKTVLEKACVTGSNQHLDQKSVCYITLNDGQ